MATEKGYGLASLVPLNARTFIRNIMREEGDTSSLLAAEDFTPEQIKLIYKQVDEGSVVDKDRGIIQADSYRDRMDELDDESVNYVGHPSLIDQFKLSFSDSPAGVAYNLGTTLGGYTAIKNSDGTVTIRDTYNWTGQKGDPKGELNITLSEFLGYLPRMIKDLEGAGNVAMRSIFKDKKSPVEFTLPPRQGADTPIEMPEGFRAGGRVRLI